MNHRELVCSELGIDEATYINTLVHSIRQKPQRGVEACPLHVCFGENYLEVYLRGYYHTNNTDSEETPGAVKHIYEIKIIETDPDFVDGIKRLAFGEKKPKRF